MRVLSGLCGCWLAAIATAQSPEHPEPPLDEVVVVGEFPGPGMWKVTRADDPAGHVLWIVGDPSPLPKGWQWKSKNIQAAAATAQEILFDAGITLTSDEKIGLFRGLTLLPSAMKARRNPDDAKLAEVLPADLYARWQVLKKRYLWRESGVESWRPLFAAKKLLDAAYDDLDLNRGGVVSSVVRKLAAKRKIKQTTPLLTYTFKRSEVRDRIKEFSHEVLADQDCFRTSLDLAEALGRTDIENARARAWAAGDLAALSALPELPNPSLPCVAAVMSAQVTRDLVPADIRERVVAKWIEAAEAGLSGNQTTFAVVPFGKLVRADGYLDRLRARGYSVEAPN